MHKLGKEGQGIVELYCPLWVLLENTGQIVVVCSKNKNYLQFF